MAREPRPPASARDHRASSTCHDVLPRHPPGARLRGRHAAGLPLQAPRRQRCAEGRHRVTRSRPSSRCSRTGGSPSAWRSPLGAWILHVAAMALAPLSVVQAVLSTGVVMLAVLAERVFGFKVGRRQWVGVGLTALGLRAAGRHAADRAGLALALLPAGDDRLRGRHARRRRAADHRASTSAPRTTTTASCSAPRPASSSASPTSRSRPSPAWTAHRPSSPPRGCS